MNDGLKQVSSEIIQTTTEVAKDVKDAVGEMIEQGVQTAVGSNTTNDQKQIEQEQKDKKELRRVRKFFQDLEQQTAQVRAANQQKEAQRLESQQQQQVKEQQEQQESKKTTVPEAILRTQAELKVGKGVGG